MKRRISRGMTLIEIMITLAILGLMAGLLFFMLSPNDDRKCKLEAERLAAWLQSASAEAVMRDYPVRAAIDLDRQKVVRELASFGAQLAAFTWTEDSKCEDFEPREKVRMTQVSTVQVPETTAGSAWLVFEGNRARGGVVVMELGEVIYSVVVYPQGGVKVEKGRAVPKDATGRSLQRLWDISSLTFPDGGLVQNPILSTGSSESALKEEPTPPVKGEEKAEPEEHEDPPHEPHEERPEHERPEPPDFQDDYDEEDDYNEEDAGEDYECESDEDCEGLWRVCRMSDHTCVVDASNHAFRVYSVDVQQPAPLREFLNILFNQQVVDENFNLVLKLGDPAGGERGEDQPYWGWTVQAQRSGNAGNMPAFTPHPDMPAFRNQATPMDCPAGYDVCYQFITEQDSHGRKPFNLYLPSPVRNQNSCQYQKLTIVATLQAYIQIGDIPGGTVAQVELTGVIRERDAKKLNIRWNGQTRKLRDVLNELGIPMDADEVDDGQPDSWTFTFSGPAYEVSLFGDPYQQIGQIPPNCQ